MIKTEIEESEMVDFFLQGLNLTDNLDELEKIRIAKKILRISNGVPLNDEDTINRQYEAMKDGLKINEKYYVNKSLMGTSKQSPMKIYGQLGLKKIKHAISSDKLRKSEFAELRAVKKQLTYEPAQDCDLDLEDIVRGDIKLEKEPKLIFLRFFGKSENIGLSKYNDTYFNSFDFLAKDKDMIPKIDSIQGNKYYQTHYYQKNKKSDIRFYSDFMGGNLWKVYETIPDNFEVFTNIETNNSLPNYWFYFKMVYAGSRETKQIIVNIKNINLGFCDKTVNIWVKRKANGISNYHRAHKTSHRKPKRNAEETVVGQQNMEAFDGWNNSIKANLVSTEGEETNNLRFTLTLKKNEECYVALSYPYFMSSFFTELKLHAHPLFNASEFRHVKSRLGTSDQV